jgi:Tfp pilus assembly protein PilX
MTKNRRSGSRRGQIILIALIALVVLAILTPALLFLLQNEARQSLKAQRATGAFNAASAGVDRALWYLRTSSASYQSVMSSTERRRRATTGT